ncbi:MAG: hypothetical protein WA674_08455 [Candidatus Acidiferrales bacterium]
MEQKGRTSAVPRKSDVRFLASVPHQIEASLDAEWGPRLAGFPVNIAYISGQKLSEGDGTAGFNVNPEGMEPYAKVCRGERGFGCSGAHENYIIFRAVGLDFTSHATVPYRMAIQVVQAGHFDAQPFPFDASE